MGLSVIKEIFNRIDILTIMTLISALILILLGLLHYFQTGETDNVFEEAAEQLIEHHTGIEIDFSS